MNKKYCNHCCQIFKNGGKCNECGSKDIRNITITIQKQSIKV
jgi:rRNA maturation endonuclease Nob1